MIFLGHAETASDKGKQLVLPGLKATDQDHKATFLTCQGESVKKRQRASGLVLGPSHHPHESQGVKEASAAPAPSLGSWRLWPK